MVGKGNLAVSEGSNVSETEEVMPTKIGVHACHMNIYLHEFCELIPIDKFFDDHGYSPWSEREIWPFLRVAGISETKIATPTKIGVHACDMSLYLHEFFEPIPIN